MNEAQATPIRDALRDVQEMWDELHRRGLNPQIMRRYSDAISVLERDFTGRLAAGVAPAAPTFNKFGHIEKPTDPKPYATGVATGGGGSNG